MSTQTKHNTSLSGASTDTAARVKFSLPLELVPTLPGANVSSAISNPAKDAHANDDVGVSMPMCVVTPVAASDLVDAANQPAAAFNKMDVHVGTQQNGLDHAQPLDPDSFPNQPRSAGCQIPATVPNVQHMLREYGIYPRYNITKKKLLITLPGHSGSFDNHDNVVLTQIISLATLNGMSTGAIPSLVEAVGDKNQFSPVATWITSQAWDGIDRLPAIYATLTEREGFPKKLKHTLMHRWLLSAVAAALLPSGFHSRGALTLQGPQSIGKTSWVRALVSNPVLRDDVVLLNPCLSGCHT